MKTARDTRGLLRRLRSYRLAGYAMILLSAVGVVQVLASVLYYDAIDRQAIRGDHARRVAELLVVSERLYERDPTGTAEIMSTAHLFATVAGEPGVDGSNRDSDAEAIKRQIVGWEPALTRRALRLEIVAGSHGRRDLRGSMLLRDGRWLNFRSPDLSSGWPIALRATTMTLLITLVSLAIGFAVLSRLMRPLRRLSEAADAIAHGQPMAIQESGTADVRTLARSINDMQARISGLVSDQARSFEAISHDLRTPLSRLKLASDFVDDSSIATIVSSSADEMEALLTSLQSFLRAQHLDSKPELVDLVTETRSVLAGFDRTITLSAPATAMATTYREPLQLSLRALVQNAVQYGTRAEITIAPAEDGWRIVIEDDGPGIPEDCFEKILDPFFRLDSARARNTAGFGLGIPTSHRLLTRFGGALSFAGGDRGLRVTVSVPEPSRG